MGNNFETRRIGETKTEPKKLKKKISFKGGDLNWRKFGGKTLKDVNWKKWLIIALIGGPLFGFFLFFCMVVYYSIGLPDVRNLDQYRVSQSTFIYDRNGVELYAIHGDENRESIEIFDRNNPAFEKEKCNKEPDLCVESDGYRNLILATVAIEDDRFFNHHGFDAERLFKAVISQVVPTIRARGGSTITQQYIKNTLLSPEQTISRKMRELILAVKLENVFNKEEILELYLNRIPYGSNAHGMELAAKTYFNKSAIDLTLAEAAILAALPNAPTRYSPYGNYRYAKLFTTFTEKETKKIKSESDLEQDEFVRGLLGTVISLNSANEITAETVEETSETEDKEVEKPKRLTPENTEIGNGHIYIKGRADLVLQRMEQLGFITEKEKKEALAESWDKEFIRARENIMAPHFVLHIKQLLEEKYGKEVVEQGGLKVYTTIDSELQKIAEEAVTERKDFNQTNFESGNIALVSLDRDTSEVVAMVGSADYFDEEIDGSVNMVMSYVQPGSSFKPFVFALAFARGMLQPATILYDVETGFGGHSHIVENYDGEFLGPIPVRRALAQSRNVTAIKAYYLAGEQENIVPFTEGLGVEFLDGETEHGSSLSLGSAEVNLLSLVKGYTTLANYGIRREPVMILKIENNEGEILEEFESLKETTKIAFGEIIETETEETSELSNLRELTPEPAENLNRTLTRGENGEVVLDPEAAYLINDILSDTEHRLGPNLTVPGWQNVAKTGTSNKRFDNGTPENKDDDKILPSNTLTIGFTSELVTGVWSGNSDGSVLRWNANGYDTAAPIWKNYMVGAHAYLTTEKNINPSPFRSPAGITKMEISQASGLLPNSESTPSDQVTEEIFASYAIPTEVEDKFVKVEIDKKTKKLWTPNCPDINRLEKDMQVHRTNFSDYTDWQEGIDKWAEEEESFVPKETCDDDYDREFDVDPSIMVLAPHKFAEVPFKPFKVYTYASSPNGISHVEFYLGEQLQFQDKTSPFIGTIRPPVTARAGSKRIITVRVYDSYGFAKEEVFEVRFDPRLSEIKKPDGFDKLYENDLKTSPTELDS
ncbi:hypothetical protein HOG48_00555 [Candidatus Peregrinibacteria bacterium]|nr:hypothetical protein [Candidatus Peregrinibacteria bacterium]